MTKRLPAVLVFGFLFAANGLNGQDILTFGPMIDLHINVGRDACPTVCDWDNDGRMDLLVGQQEQGKIRLYMNQGTVDQPVFHPEVWTFVQRNGQELTTPKGC